MKKDLKEFIDDSVDIGKKPLPIEDEKLKAAYEKVVNKYRIKWKKNEEELFHVDAILHNEMTPEEREEDLIRLKEESDKLNDWIKM